jgi:MFS family permease
MPIRGILGWTLIPGLITVGLALSIREPRREAVQGKPAFNWTLQGFSPEFRRYLLVLALFTLGNSSNMFLLLRARDMGLPEDQVPLLWALVAAIATLFSTPLSALSDRIGRTRLIVAGWGVYGAFYLLLGLNGHTLWMLWPLFAFYGLFMAATEGAEKALVADLAPRKRIGAAYGWFNLTAGAMLLPASLLFGWLWQSFSPEAAFGFGAGCALLAAVLLQFWVPAAFHR